MRRDTAVETRQSHAAMPSRRGGSVEVTNVTHSFATRRGSTQALDAVSLQVRSGEFVSLVGPSGCGKSTLLMLIGGLLRPTSGAISIDDAPVQGPVGDLGIVFQTPLLLAWRNALDNVLLQLEMRDLPKADYRDHANELLAKVGLSKFADRLPHELSGGMKQRVSICRALIHDPPLLLMDEPFGALDALTRDQLTLDVQKLWSDRKKTVILVTHSIVEAVFLSDRIVVMTPHPGRVDCTISIDLPRPRSLRLRETPAFNAYERAISERFLAHGVLRDIENDSFPAT